MSILTVPRELAAPVGELTWRPVVGCETRYEVSNQGQVRRVRDGYVLREEPIVGGYHRVSLSKNGVSRKKLVHCLVAEAFIGPRPEGMEVDHEDGNPHHNALSNLRYLTPAQNVQASFAKGIRMPARGERHASAVLDDQLVTSMRIMHQLGASKAALARMVGVNFSTAQRVVERITWRHIP